MTHQTIFLILFMLTILAMLFLDLFVFHKKDHEIKIKEAAVWTGVWIGVGLLFALFLRLKGEWIYDLDFATVEGLESYRKELTMQYLSGYFLEKSLSIDNIFVMIMIFSSFGIEKRYYHRVLFWGILGAIVLRFIFIFSLGALVQQFSWLLAIFGVILLYSGVKMFLKKGEEEVDTQNHPVVRFASKHFRVSPRCDGHNFFTRIDGKRFLTPLFLVLLVIEFSDIIFAVDSIPAVFSVSSDPVIVYTSNIFAIMGLRSLFFLLDGITGKFWLLHYGLGLLLCFIGLKMIGHEFFGLNISTGASLFTILAILVSSISLSLIIKKNV